VPEDAIHRRPDGFAHSLWDLLYHLWFTQRDILLFCRDPAYTEPEWPAAYWPTPETPGDWTGTLAAFADDLEAMIGLTTTGDLFAEFEHAPGYTLIREVLLVADHNAHHLGQVIGLRRALGCWPPPSLG
ncbi:MAG: DinB family protein, partial [Bacteroidota bacterium]